MPAEVCLLLEYWCACSVGPVRSRHNVEEPSGVMDYHDTDLFANESVYDSIGALDYFVHGWVNYGSDKRPRHGNCLASIGLTYTFLNFF